MHKQINNFRRHKVTVKKDPNGNKRNEKKTSKMENILNKFNMKLNIAKEQAHDLEHNTEIT